MHLNGLPVLAPTPEAVNLARALGTYGPVPDQADVDAFHIAIATVHGIEYLLTWNCAHIANAQMRAGIESDNLTWDTPYEDLPNTHPRTSGSFATVLRLARENNIPLMQAESMTSYNYARPLGEMGLKSMQVRGRMQEGMVADITIFNPETVRDNSTYAKGTLPSTGIIDVIVNGVIVMKDQEPLKGVNPGQPIRFRPVKSRFKPLKIESWMHKYYASPHRFWRRSAGLTAFLLLTPAADDQQRTRTGDRPCKHFRATQRSITTRSRHGPTGTPPRIGPGRSSLTSESRR